jgi:DNA sulfur modification protein DndE
MAKIRLLLINILITLFFSVGPVMAKDAPQSSAQANLVLQAKENLAYTIGVQAYIYGYPTVELYRTFYEQVLDPKRGHSIGVNEFNHIRKLVTPQDTWVVSPNNDTLYSRAWLDLSKEPIVLHIPPIKGRFYAFPIGDFYHDAAASLGWWNVGEDGGNFALIPPGWQGVLPDNVEAVHIDTPMCWLLARTLTSGDEEDLKKVHALMDQYSLTPLSQWGKTGASKAKFERNYPAWNNDNPLNFFVILNEMLRLNPPRPADEGLVATFKEIGMHPSQRFDLESVDDAVRNGLTRAIIDAQGIMATKNQSMAKLINGWLYLPGPKEFGTDYLFRAALEAVALLHGDSEMTVGYIGNIDGLGKPLDGKNDYKIKFDVPPPVMGFWSLTLYDGKSKLLFDNPINRYSIGDRTEGIQYGENGSLTIYLSNQEPDGDAVSNWLPSPKGPFYVVIRAYNARPEVFNGSWSPPPIVLNE